MVSVKVCWKKMVERQKGSKSLNSHWELTESLNETY